MQEAATNVSYRILSSQNQKRSPRVSQDAATNVSCCIPDTHSQKVSALVYLPDKVKISRTFENVLPLMVSAIVG
jgi:hypothetical protein